MADPMCTCGPYHSVLPPPPCPVHSGACPTCGNVPQPRCPNEGHACNCTGACTRPAGVPVDFTIYTSTSSAYIPLAVPMRDRSKSILEAVANTIGGGS